MNLRPRTLAATAALLGTTLSLNACAAANQVVEGFERTMVGATATVRTYDKQGAVMDEITGKSIQVTRDERFDIVENDGKSIPGDMLHISVGKNSVNHVGSTLILTEAGVEQITPAAKGMKLEDENPGSPWMNRFFEKNRNLWKGAAKTVLVRSQDDVPVAIFQGDEVELGKSSIPKSTVLRIVNPGKAAQYVMVYRANITIYDSALLEAGKSASGTSSK